MNSCFEQQRVSAAHVMVVGCGALGNEVLKNLVLLGVEHIVAVILIGLRWAICRALSSFQGQMQRRIV